MGSTTLFPIASSSSVKIEGGHSLSGVSSASSESTNQMDHFRHTECTNIVESSEPPLDSKTARPSHGFSAYGSWDVALKKLSNDSHRSSASALDALAALASSARNLNVVSGASSMNSSDEDSDSMPPPPPRRKGRFRSASNPEGMEKWDSYSQQSVRRHFVLPSAILEEELANANYACEAHQAQISESAVALKKNTSSRPFKKRSVSFDEPIQQQHTYSYDQTSLYGTSPTTVMSNIPMDMQKSPSKENDQGLVLMTKTEEEEEMPLNSEELLRRARTKLLEDLSTETGSEKGGVTLPHDLEKYQEIYNKNGRIGIYTPAERAAIIAKFNSKRSKRVWNKKIRYNCRKNLADRRLRVKGRFVKRSVEDDINSDNSTECNDTSILLQANSPISSSPLSGPLAPVKENSDEAPEDEDMPDVNDPEAGFTPTESQPYRRVRRHTIT